MSDKSSLNDSLSYITVGLELGVTIFIFVYGGYRLDLHFDKSPLFLSVGAFLGMLIGFYNLIRVVQSIDKKKKAKKDKNDDIVKWM